MKGMPSSEELAREYCAHLDAWCRGECAMISPMDFLLQRAAAVVLDQLIAEQFPDCKGLA